MGQIPCKNETQGSMGQSPCKNETLGSMESEPLKFNIGLSWEFLLRNQFNWKCNYGKNYHCEKRIQVF